MTDGYDAFISHTSEDKELVARPLAGTLTRLGLRVWFDEFTLEVGDSLVESIDKGLASSRFGGVILSPSFLSKGWPKYELRGLLTREIGKRKVVLPIWHQISRSDIERISPSLADKFALDTTRQDLDEIALLLVKVIRPDIFENLTRYAEWRRLKSQAKLEYRSLDELKPGPIRHESLPDDLRVRAKIVQTILRDVLGLELNALIDSLQRDFHPHEELQVWERIAATYLDLTSGEELSQEERERLFADLLAISMQPRELLEKMLAESDDRLRRLVFAYAHVVPPMPNAAEERQ